MKEKIITRTVVTLEVHVMGLDENNLVAIRVFNLPVIDDKKILPFLMNKSNDSFTPAKVVKVETVEQLYGMPESLFMKYAEKLPPRKIYNTEKAEG